MIISFYSKGEEDIFDGFNSKLAREKCPRKLWRIARRKLDQLDSVTLLLELKIPPGNMFEKLKGSRKGQYSIRINDKYRICFTWSGGAENVEIVDYHQ